MLYQPPPLLNYSKCKNTATEYSTIPNINRHPQKNLQDSTMENSVRELAPFERLPNEVLLMIIRMAMEDIPTDHTHNFLTDVIGNISTRFSCLPSYPPFWKGRVFLRLGTPLEKAWLPDGYSQIFRS